MKKSFLSILTLMAFCASGFSQFYYKDIVSNQQLIADMALYKQNKIRSINIKSYESDGQPSEGFFCEKKISKNYQSVSLFTRTEISGASLFTSIFSNDGKLLGTTDSSKISVTRNTYSYDNNNHIQSINSTILSNDDDFTNEITEQHIYFYDTEGLPEKMIRIKNNSDSTTIFFAKDDNNNIGIEKNSKTGGKYYYYYDAKKRLTDIVQSNDATNKLIPDYVFEYNGAGQLSQMTSTEEGGNFYLVWKYSYYNGMRLKEKCYGRGKSLLGSVEYEYK